MTDREHKTLELCRDMVGLYLDSKRLNIRASETIGPFAQALLARAAMELDLTTYLAPNAVENGSEEARKEEREACACIADDVAQEADEVFRTKAAEPVSDGIVTEQKLTAERIASAIRARGEASHAIA